MRRVLHLVDDTSPGGVTRLLDFIRTSAGMAAIGQHEVLPVRAGVSLPPRLRADVIVSHVVLSWRNLPFFAALRARHPRTPLLHMEHSYSPAFAALHVARPVRFALMLRASLSLFDRVVTISTAQRDWLAATARLPARKLALIPPCVDLSRFLDLPPAPGLIRRIGAIGRLDLQKGFDVLIPAFRKAELAGVTLEIFGHGPEADRLRWLAGDHPAIVFHGHTADPVAAVASVDAIAMPSRREPYGLVALEARAAGRPLLTAEVDGLIDHTENGAIGVADLSVEAWAAALRDLVATDHAARVAEARATAAHAEHSFVDGWRALLSGL